MIDLIELILLDEEINDFLREMVSSGCDLRYQALSDLERYRQGIIGKDDLMENLQAEWEFQTKKDRAGTRTHEKYLNQIITH